METATDRYGEFFYRRTQDGNARILHMTGEVVTRLDANVYPVGSEVSARYEHPEGIVLTIEDANRPAILPE